MSPCDVEDACMATALMRFVRLHVEEGAVHLEEAITHPRIRTPRTEVHLPRTASQPAAYS